MKITSVATDTGGSNGLVTLDCNGDGVMDLVALNRAGSLSVFIGNKDTTFQAPRKIVFPQTINPVSIDVGDLNGDGLPDLAVGSTSPPMVYTLLGDSNCGFTPQTPIAVVRWIDQIALADINGDGKLDLLLTNGDFQAYFGDGSGGFGPPFLAAPGIAPMFFSIADLNSDGEPDLVDAAGWAVWLAFGDGSGVFHSPTYHGLSGLARRPAIGDINGDGKPDFAITGESGLTMVFTNTSTPDTINFQPYVVGSPARGPAASILTTKPNWDKQDQLIVPATAENAVYAIDLGASPSLDVRLGFPSIFPYTRYAPVAAPVAVVALPSGGLATAGSDGITFLDLDCPASLSPANVLYFGPNPTGPQIVQLNIPVGCPWNSVTPSHISVTPPAGVGPGAVLVQAQPNSGDARTAAITFSSGVNRTGMPVTQAKAGSACTEPSVDRTSLTVGPAGGTVQLAVTLPETGDGCRTTAGTTNPAVTVTPGDIPGAKNPTPVSFTVPANPGDTKSFYAMAGPNLITITSTGACPVTIGSFNGTLAAGIGATVTIPVSVPPGCSLNPTERGLLAGTSMPDPSHVVVRAALDAPGTPWTGSVNIGGRLAHIIQKLANATPAFDDVPLTHPYSDWITLLKGWGVTKGCSPATYCPEDPVTRGQMAVFIIRSVEQADTFPYNTTPYFNDVPVSHVYFKYIQRMKDLGITVGCGNGNYCPNDPVTRGQMAVFLMRARKGLVGGVPMPYPGDPFFTDVPPSDPYYAFIQNMRAMGITVGCTETTYCGLSPVTRGQMAVFLIRTFFTPW